MAMSEAHVAAVAVDAEVADDDSSGTRGKVARRRQLRG